MQTRGATALLIGLGLAVIACEQGLVTGPITPTTRHSREEASTGGVSKLEKVRSIAQGCSFSVATRDGNIRTVAVALQRLPFELPPLRERSGKKVGGKIIGLP